MTSFYTNFFVHRGELYIREINSGKHAEHKYRPKPFLFVPTQDADTKYTTPEGTPVVKKVFNSIFDAREFIKQMKDMIGYEVHGATNFAYPLINERYPGSVEFDPSMICVANLDIEVAGDEGFPDPMTASKPITAITVKLNGVYHVFTACAYTPHRPDVELHPAANEQTLIMMFLEFWTERSIDVITGWYIDFFDIPYIMNRIARVLGPDYIKLMSPWRMVESREVVQNGRTHQAWTIHGLSVIDYMRAYQKFIKKPRENYKLDHIAWIELNERKTDYSEYGTLLKLYKENPQKFIEYNIRDVELVDRLEELLGLLDLIFTVSYYCKINYEDAFGTVKMWETLIHNHLLEKNQVVRSKSDSSKRAFEGGYVKDVKKGGYDWVVSYDYDSLYPHLIMALNISPEMIDGMLEKSIDVPGLVNREAIGATERAEIGDRALAASGHLYKRDKLGFFAEIMDLLYSQRTMYKKKMQAAKKILETDPDNAQAKKDSKRYFNSQLGVKYILNSGYGAMANEFFVWFDIRLAESTTLSGQMAIQWVARDVNDELNRILSNKNKIDYIIAIDTDSFYLELGPFIKKVFEGKNPTDDEVRDFIDKHVSPLINKMIKESTDNWAKYMNAYAPRLNMKREMIATKGIWRAKKAYALNVIDDEGIRKNPPEITVKGIEVVRSSTPQVCRDKLKEALVIIMNKTEPDLQNFVKQFENEFGTMKFEDIAFPRSVNGLDTYSAEDGSCKLGTPQNTRAALTYNRMIRGAKLDGKYETISNGDRIKFAYLKVPNPTGENIMAISSILPPELGLERYIDYQSQFETAFLKPLSGIVEAIGWSPEKKNTLAAFFT